MTKKFIINKGIDNEFTFNIKQTGSIVGMPIDNADTFVFKLLEYKTGNVVYTTNATVADAVNGKIKISIPSASTTNLNIEVGDRADYYKRKVTYKAIIVCDTVANGKFISKLDKVYVE